MKEGLWGVLQKLALFSPLLPIALILFLWKDLQNKKLAGSLIWLLCVDFFIDISTVILSVWTKWVPSTHSIHHLYEFLFLIVSFNIYRQGFSNPKKRKVIGFLFLFVGLVNLYFLITDFNLSNTNINPGSNVTILIVGVSIYWLYQTFMDMKIPSLIHDPFLWVCSAILIYRGGGFFVTLFSNAIRHSYPHVNSYLWPIYYITTVSFIIIILRAIWLMKRK